MNVFLQYLNKKADNDFNITVASIIMRISYLKKNHTDG